MKILVSACLLGENCKYSGGNNYNAAVAEFVKDKDVLTICPEMMAGMGCPRTPIEIVDGIVMDKEGNCPHNALSAAVEQILKQLATEEVECVILKSRSPTCGVRQVYDGTLSGRLVDGQGVLAKALMDAGYRVLEAEDL